MVYKIRGFQVEIQSAQDAINQNLIITKRRMKKNSLCCDLPMKRRIVFILWLAGFKRKEIAGVMGIKTSSVHQHIRRSRSKYPQAKQAFSSEFVV